MTAKEHNKIIGILHLVEGGLQIFGAILLALFLFGFGFYLKTGNSDVQWLGNWLFIAGIVLALLSFILAFVNLIAGWKMLKEKPNARIWGIVASIICLFNIPLGTIIGVYSLWFLFGVEGKQIYQEK
jgi:uncharacterized membrane protein YozB (DUF420 family)